ncbi:MAG: aminotransferase class V-fold PLP-dependent enzyme [Planctomycetia bacterium]|nr:aminotransferase class V-fold PLP-dependent enzyme [Planctomycetia bacterium]
MNALLNSPSPFAAEWMLDPNIIFLNHGSFGACPKAILKRQQELRNQMESEPLRFMEQEYPVLLNESRQRLARFVGAKSEHLVFVRSVTQAVNSVLRSYPFEDGDEILTTDHEYNACANVARFIADHPNDPSKTARKVHFVAANVPYPIQSPDNVFEALMAKVNDQTRLVLIDHVTSPSGFLQPIERIIVEMNRRGIDTLIDGSHSVGMIPLDLEKLNATFFTSNCHKWLCTPKGSAFLWVRNDWAERIYPSTISHGYNWSVPDNPKLHDLFDWPGTDDFTPWLCVGDTILFLENLLDDRSGKLEKLAQHNHDLIIAARRLLCQRLDSEPVCPESMLTSLAAIALPDEKEPPRLKFFHAASALHPIHVRLLEEFKIEVPVFNWTAYPKLTLRIAAQLYNDLSQYEKLADALDIIFRVH